MSEKMFSNGSPSEKTVTRCERRAEKASITAKESEIECTERLCELSVGMDMNSMNGPSKDTDYPKEKLKQFGLDSGKQKSKQLMLNEGEDSTRISEGRRSEKCVENDFIEFMLKCTAQHNTSIARFPGLFKRRLERPHKRVELAFETLPCDYYRVPVKSGTEEPVESELESETEDDELELEEGMYTEDSTEDEYDTLSCDNCIVYVEPETEEPVVPETEDDGLELEQGMDIEDSTEDESDTDDDSDDMEYNEEKLSFGSFIMDAPLMIGNSGGDARISDFSQEDEAGKTSNGAY